MPKAKRLPSGRWRTRLYLGQNGKGKKVYKSFTATTKRESEFMASEYEMNHIIRDSTKILKKSVAEVVEAFINDRSKSLSPNTVRVYKNILKNQIMVLDKTPVNTFTPTKHQQWVDRISLDLTPKGVQNANSLLVTALKYYKITVPPVQLPQKQYKELKIPTTEDVKRITEYFIDRNDKDMVLAILLAAIGTLRRGEVCALTAEDVDFENKTISIRKSMARAEDGSMVLKEPKTFHSNRTIPLPGEVIRMMPKTGKIVNLNLNQISDRFYKAVIKLKMPRFNFHSLRHYAASIMHAQNIPTQYIMERGGWKSEQTLNRIYRNSLDDYKKRFNDQTNNYFKDNLL